MRVPHFSSNGAWTDIGHIRPYGYFSFDCFQKGAYQSFYTNARFHIKYRKIKYLGLYPNAGLYETYIHKNQCPSILRPFVHAVNFLINLSPMFFERYWCHLVGGACETEFILEKSVEE